MSENNPLLGKIITAVFLSEGGGAIKFILDSSEEIIVRADGDCCSRTWIEAIQGLEQLLGSPVRSVEDVELSSTGEQGNDVTVFYGCKIFTEKGYTLIDFRNNSNGYYGGNLSWPDDSFYGGVFGQNGSIEGWTQVSV